MRKSVWFVLVAALVLRLGLVPMLAAFTFPDEFWYTDIAQNLLAGRGYVMSSPEIARLAACKAPGQPFVLAAWGILFPLTAVSVTIANSILNWCGIVFLILAASRLCRNIWSQVLAALFAGFHPAVLYLGLTNYPQNGQLFFLGLLVLRLSCRTRSRFVDMLGDGVLVGLGALFVPTHIFTVPALIVFYAISGLRGVSGEWECRGKSAIFSQGPFPAVRQFFNLFLKNAFALFVGGTLAVAPWMLRNAIVEKEFVPFSCTAGQQFYLGFNEQAGMNTGTKIVLSGQLESELADAPSAKDFERVFMKYGLRWVVENPVRTAQLWGLKFVNWFRWDNGGLYTTLNDPGYLLTWVQRLSTLFTFMTCAAGCFFWWPREKRWPLLIAVLMFANAFGHAFFISRYRYRLPFEPLLLLVGMCGVFEGIRRQKIEV